MTQDLKCPKCGSTAVIEEEYYDTENSFSAIKELCYGYCEECGANLQWTMLYTFSGYDEIEEG